MRVTLSSKQNFMADTKSVASKKISKKEAKQIVYEKLSSALAEYRSELKGKKFEQKLKKASKLFAFDIAKIRRKTRNLKVKAKKPKEVLVSQ
jgi:hypothetical protein